MKSDKLVFGFDLGTNSIGWAVMHEDADGTPKTLLDIGSRIFLKAVEDKTPTPKNNKRSGSRSKNHAASR